MRILSVGHPLPGTHIDNHSFLNAPSFFDYEAVIVDPQSISQVVDDLTERCIEHRTYSGECVVNQPSDADSVSLGELLHNRADETARLLANGGLVICLASPNAVHEGIEGYATFSRYSWLPAPAGLVYDDPFMKRGAGSEFSIPDQDHPFGAMLNRIKEKLTYQVYFDELDTGFKGQVIARSAGGAAVAIDMAVGGGTVVLLPPSRRALDSQSRYEASEAIQQAIRQLQRPSSASKAPRWVVQYPLPGMDALLDEREALVSERDKAQAALAKVGDEVETLALFQRLLWDEGRYGLEEAIHASLALLGFSMTQGRLGAPTRVEFGSGLLRRGALLETDGSEEYVGLDVHYRMRRLMEDALTKGSPQRGIVIINGFRRTAPSERRQQYSKELRLAAEQLRYCLATSEQLFCAVQAFLNGDVASVERFRDRLLTAEGVLPDD